MKCWLLTFGLELGTLAISIGFFAAIFLVPLVVFHLLFGIGRLVRKFLGKTGSEMLGSLLTYMFILGLFGGIGIGSYQVHNKICTVGFKQVCHELWENNKQAWSLKEKN